MTTNPATRCNLYVYRLQDGPHNGAFFITNDVMHYLVTGTVVSHTAAWLIDHIASASVEATFERYRCVRDPFLIAVEPHFVATALAMSPARPRPLVVDIALAHDMCGLAVHEA